MSEQSGLPSASGEGLRTYAMGLLIGAAVGVTLWQATGILFFFPLFAGFGLALSGGMYARERQNRRGG